MEERVYSSEKNLEEMSKKLTDKMDTVLEAPNTSTQKGSAQAEPLDTPPSLKKIKTTAAKGGKIHKNVYDLKPELADRIRRAGMKLTRDANSKRTYDQKTLPWFKEKSEHGQNRPETPRVN
ncbi:hypothetical protein SNE40_005421 [Patella caerulea]|uniref:Uncharacterized protein n=1 Tax=Patella caerulea TaxID=87958 RepID=A0AAN8K1N2_PATCE